MIKSMTGFGRNKYEKDSRQYQVEIKSVNNRYSDISIKSPKIMIYLEEKIKKEITKTISRGKIDIFINFFNNSDKGKKITINQDIAKVYIKELQKLAKENNIENNINIMEIAKFPDVLNLNLEETEEILIEKELMICLKGAIDSFVKMRETEGNKIKQDLLKRIDKVCKKIEKININSTRLVEEYIVKLETRIKEVLKNNTPDQSRLAQEVVIYADKCSIEEELTRLNSHIDQFKNLLEENNPIGKKLDFLIQEINREINTIGSKANNLEITQLVVDLKTEIENIREQIQNIE